MCCWAEATAATGVLTLTAESGASTVVRFSRTGGGTVTKTVTGDGANPVAVVLSNDDLATLGSGSISVTAVATDKAGNKSSTTNLSFNLNTSTTPPVAIDLNRDGAIGYSQVVMDVNGDGQLDHTAWVGPNDGLLVWDKYLDGMVRSPSQFVFATQAGQTDLQGLAAQFDTNHDGVFDAQDALFGQFAVWQDRNQNGATDMGEVRSLADWGIQSMALKSDGVLRSPATGVHESGRSTTTNADGTQMLVADASFDFATLTRVAVSSAVLGQVDLASDASANLLRVSLQDVLAQPTPNLFNASNTSTINGTGLKGTEAKHQLMVRGSANDFAQVSNLSTDWSPTDTVVACEGQSYSVYNAKTSDAQLLIDLRMVNASHVL